MSFKLEIVGYATDTDKGTFLTPNRFNSESYPVYRKICVESHLVTVGDITITVRRNTRENNKLR